MKSTKMTFLITLLFAVLLALPVHARQGVDNALAEKMSAEVQRAMLAGNIPSATAALVRGEEIVWAEGFGYSNIWAKTPAVPKTVYLIGSTFKAMSMTALLQQMEAGKFKLDDAVNDYLEKFKIQNETDGQPVTFRHMFSHTSGLPVAFGPHPVWGESVPRSLEEYLTADLKVQKPPLQEVVYSNIAYALMAHLLEKFSGEDYKSYIKKRIFEPLEMNDTEFMPRPEMEERLAIPYVIDQTTGKPAATVRLKADVWPAGIVYGTILNQANWLIANLNDGKFKGKNVISKATLNQIMTRQYDQFAGPISAGWLNETTGFGLTWWISERNGDTLFAHSGSVPGYTAFLVGNRQKKHGFAILTNGNRAHKHLFELAVKALDILEETAE